MSSGIAIATLRHIRGETIIFGLRSTPAYDGTETVTCDVKKAVNEIEVPAAAQPVVQEALVQFDQEQKHYTFTLSAAQSDELTPGDYITDARVEYADGTVDYPLPLGIKIAERVTS